MSKLARLARILTCLSFCSFFIQSCTSGAGRATGPLTGKTVYTRVCQKTEGKETFYKGSSTNYIGLPDALPVGTSLRVLGSDGNIFLFAHPKNGNEIRIEFVEKHNRMSAEAWFEENFSRTPPALPQNLTAQERKAIQSCTAEQGISRQALFLALGYPPASLSPNRNASTLVYQWKRFDKRTFVFNPQGKVMEIRD